MNYLVIILFLFQAFLIADEQTNKGFQTYFYSNQKSRVDLKQYNLKNNLKIDQVSIYLFNKKIYENSITAGGYFDWVTPKIKDGIMAKAKMVFSSSSKKVNVMPIYIYEKNLIMNILRKTNKKIAVLDMSENQFLLDFFNDNEIPHEPIQDLEMVGFDLLICNHFHFEYAPSFNQKLLKLFNDQVNVIIIDPQPSYFSIDDSWYKFDELTYSQFLNYNKENVLIYNNSSISTEPDSDGLVVKINNHKNGYKFLKASLNQKSFYMLCTDLFSDFKSNPISALWLTEKLQELNHH